MADKYLEDTSAIWCSRIAMETGWGGEGEGRRRLRHRELENLYTRTHATTLRNAVTHASTHTDSRAHLYTDEFVHAQGTFYFRHGASPPNSPQYPAPARSFVLSDKLYRWSTRFKLCTFLSKPMSRQEFRDI